MSLHAKKPKDARAAWRQVKIYWAEWSDITRWHRAASRQRIKR